MGKNTTAHTIFHLSMRVQDCIGWSPISSKIEKYEAIYNKKIQQTGKCDTLMFGRIQGQKKAFLIQNMCPVNETYIEGEYLDIFGRPVGLDRPTAEELNRKSKLILSLHKKGYKVIFPDVTRIEKFLLSLSTK